MGNFRRENRGSYSGRSSSRSSFGGRDRNSGRNFGGRDRDSKRSERGPVEMHEVICSKCGKECEVPFKPTGDKPVYCKECFDKNSLNREPRGSSSGISQEQFNQLNTKLDKILELLETLEIEYDEEE